MQPVSLPHPTDRALSDFSLGKLDDRAAHALSKHLETCADCRNRVAQMSGDSFLDRVRDAQNSTPHSDDGQSQVARTTNYQSKNENVVPTEPENDDRPRGYTMPPTETRTPDGDEHAHSPIPHDDMLPHGLADHPDYQIKKELGRGGMGVVYLAHNNLMGRDEVLKVMGRHMIERPGLLDRFLREIRAVAKLHHPNIVTAYSAVRIGENIVFGMEYIDGLDLARLLKAKGQLPVAHACLFVHQAALGLQHAHERGLIHRDIKPANLILSREGNKATVKVLDFGLAKVVREEKVASDITSQGQALGTPDYMAPEQILDAQSADIRADIYSLGATLYYLLAGRPPFLAKTLYDIYQAHISLEADHLNLIRPEVPAELGALVAKMMAKDPDRRFQTPGEVAQALVPFFKRGSAEVKAVSPEASRGEPSQFRPQARVGPKPTPASPPPPPPSTLPDVLKLPEPEVKRELIAETAEKRGRRSLWVAVAAGLFLLGLAGSWMAGLIRFSTNDGVLLVENYSPDKGDLFIDSAKQSLSLKTADGLYELSLPIGKHAISLKKGEMTILVREVEIATKGTPIRVSMEPQVTTASDFTPLFNGKDKTGWKLHPSQQGDWRVENGVLIGSGPKSNGTSSYLYSDRGDYKDFHLRVRARINKKGNSGVMLRSSFGPSLEGKVPASYEAAISGVAGDPVATGGFYISTRRTIFPSQAKAVAPGEWFDMDITVQANRIVVKLNGDVASSFRDEQSTFTSGHLALQVHDSDTVAEFSNVEIKELPTEPVPSPLATNSGRIPPEGPSRRARGVNGEFWSLDGDDMVKEGLGPGWIDFGDASWTDYILTFKFRKTAGDGFGVNVRMSDAKWFWIWLGGHGNTKHAVGTGMNKKLVVSELRSVPGTIRSGEWYRVKITCRGMFIRVELDDHILFRVRDSFSERGFISLHCLNSAARFNDIKVTTLDGTTLWEGPPNLPRKK